MSSRYARRFVGSMAVVLGSLAFGPFERTSEPDFGAPLAGLAVSDLDKFATGKAEFLEVETIAGGIGPVFNEASCATCDLTPAIGGGSTRLETRFETATASGEFDPMSQYGGSLIQSQGIGASGSCNYLAEVVPLQATIVATRRTTPLFGLGLVDAVPDGRSG